MITRRNSQGRKVFSIITLVFLMGCYSFLIAQRPEIIESGLDETFRSISISNLISEKPTLIVGTSKGNLYFTEINSEISSGDIEFQQFKTLTGKPSVIREINFGPDKKLYLIKNDGLFVYDKEKSEWKPKAGLDRFAFSQTRGWIAELWGMTFVNNRTCIVGGNFKDDFIDREIIKCNDNIGSNVWIPVKSPVQRKFKNLQLTNIYFDKKSLNGWAVGTEGEKGIIWFSKDGGNNWTEEENDLRATPFTIDGNSKMVFTVGSDGMIFSKNLEQTQPERNRKIVVIEKNKEVKIDIAKLTSVNTLKYEVTGIVQDLIESNDKKLFKIKITKVTPEPPSSIRLKAILENVYFDESAVIKNEIVDESNDWTERNDLSEKISNTQLNSVKFNSDGTYGFIVGKNGTILMTDNGGNDWKLLPANEKLKGIDLYSIYFGKEYCWIAGSKGAIVRIKYKT